MHISQVTAALFQHVFHTLRGNQRVDDIEAQSPILPITSPRRASSPCVVADCDEWSHIASYFNNGRNVDIILLCKAHYKFAVQFIINRWTRDELHQRILIVRSWQFEPWWDNIDNCNRCGIRSACYHRQVDTYRPVCYNCYEYARGNKCRLAIIVLHQAINVVDVIRYIVTTLHQSFMPNYSNIDQQIDDLYSSVNT